MFWGAIITVIKASGLQRIASERTLLYQLGVSALLIPLGFAVVLCPQFLDHLRLEFLASLACGGLAAPPAICSRIGAFWPIPLWGRSSL